MIVEEMTKCGVSANQDDLLERRTEAAFLEQPEQALNRNIHHVVGSFLAGRAVQHVSNASHGLSHDFPIRHAALHNYQALVRIEKPVVTQRAHTSVAQGLHPENSTDRVRTHFACRTGNEEASHWFCQ